MNQNTGHHLDQGDRDSPSVKNTTFEVRCKQEMGHWMQTPPDRDDILPESLETGVRRYEGWTFIRKPYQNVVEL